MVFIRIVLVDFQIVDVVVDFDDFFGEFMVGDQWNWDCFGGLVILVLDVNVGVVNFGFVDFDQDIVGIDFGNWCLGYLEVFVWVRFFKCFYLIVYDSIFVVLFVFLKVCRVIFRLFWVRVVFICEWMWVWLCGIMGKKNLEI